MTKQKSDLIAQIIDLRNEKININKEKGRLKVQVEKTKKDKPKSLCLGIMDSMDKLISGFYGRYSRSRIGSAIADACWNFCDGVAQFELMHYA